MNTKAQNKSIATWMWISLSALILVAGITSCNDDDDRYPLTDFVLTYGVAQASDIGYTILTDGGKTLHITKNRHPGFQLSDGKRVFVNYTVLGQNANDYFVCINELTGVLTKQPVGSSSLSQQGQDSIGHDAIEVSEMWFGGQKFLNIHFKVYRYYSSITHFINLVLDEEQSTPERKVVQFRHNAYDDLPQILVPGRVSFDISSLLAQDQDSVKLVVEWETYNQGMMQDSGYYKRPDIQSNEFKSFHEAKYFSDQEFK